MAVFAVAFGSFAIDQNPKENIVDHPEYSMVNSAISDYVEGIYKVDPARIEKSVHPELRKRGYWFSSDKNEYSGHLDMTYDQLHKLAGNWNKDGKSANDDSPRDIEVFEITDKTATAKLTAEWGMDYFHLVKLDDKWVIMNVLWQSAPQK